MNLSFALVWLLFLAGCVTRAVQTEALLAEPGNLVAYHEIKNVSFIDQSVGYCGPATLTMAMRWAGQDVSVENIAAQAYNPGLKGTLQTDLISTSRRNGLMAVPIKDLYTLLKEVSAGHPVIVFENLSFNWAPNWHYALVLGYDLNKKEIIMHSGHDAYYHWDLEKFERSWMLGEYWGLVVLPAGKLSATGNELGHVTAAVGLEQAKKINEAEKSYRVILEKWPTSLVALIGLANITYKNGHKKEAISLLRRATKAHPESDAAKSNLEVALASQ